MRISELSERSGVSSASIKYYTREGLLPAGERTGYNQTDYTDSHLGRLRLLRALIEAGGLTIARARTVLAAIDDESMPVYDTLGVAQGAIEGADTPASPESRARVLELAAARGWRVHPGNPGIDLAAGILDRYAELGREDLAAALPAYLEATERIAAADLSVTPMSGDRAAAAETAVVGTVLGDTLVAGLRRMAQQHLSSTALDPTGDVC
ncbi:MerR family transcriptional regulator [uncultured Schumannella sp.]|uniref:MerR family transcriptional regulator n=1 Tax=uncultured Schumannella sp. TaxID=1195956 RepID=UPI0025CC5DD4|nr:MerR family transcriptional regulator [uncultured Schumannella sp.]